MLKWTRSWSAFHGKVHVIRRWDHGSGIWSGPSRTHLKWFAAYVLNLLVYTEVVCSHFHVCLVAKGILRLVQYVYEGWVMVAGKYGLRCLGVHFLYQEKPPC